METKTKNKKYYHSDVGKERLSFFFLSFPPPPIKRSLRRLMYLADLASRMTLHSNNLNYA